MSIHYDYAMLGGGASALMLAYSMMQESSLSQKKVLIIEPQLKNQNDRTWCYWHDSETPFDHLAQQKWKKLAFKAPNFEAVLDIAPLHYYMLRGIDFYNFVQDKLAKSGHVTWIQGRAESTEELENGIKITLQGGASYMADFAFDSRLSLKILRQEKKSICLLQHFKGFLVHTPTPSFDKDCPTIFDFNISQEGEVRFVYTLPLSSERALVEYTIFSDNLLPDKKLYDDALETYLRKNLGLLHYEIEEEEAGVIPMSNHLFERRVGKRLLRIGLAGGLAKASTGYAFMRCVRDAEAITKSLVNHSHPFVIAPASTRFRLYDSTILNLMQTNGGKIRDHFTDLFSKNPTARLLRFLDDQTSFAEDISIMSSVPIHTFAGSMGKMIVSQYG